MTTPADPLPSLTAADIARAQEAVKLTLTRHWPAMRDLGGPTQGCIVDAVDVAAAVFLQAIHGRLDLAAAHDAAASKPTDPTPNMTTRSPTRSRSTPRRATK